MNDPFVFIHSSPVLYERNAILFTQTRMMVDEAWHWKMSRRTGHKLLALIRKKKLRNLLRIMQTKREQINIYKKIVPALKLLRCPMCLTVQCRNTLLDYILLYIQYITVWCSIFLPQLQTIHTQKPEHQTGKIKPIPQIELTLQCFREGEVTEKCMSLFSLQKQPLYNSLQDCWVHTIIICLDHGIKSNE